MIQDVSCSRTMNTLTSSHKFEMENWKKKNKNHNAHQEKNTLIPFASVQSDQCRLKFTMIDWFWIWVFHKKTHFQRSIAYLRKINEVIILSISMKILNWTESTWGFEWSEAWKCHNQTVYKYNALFATVTLHQNAPCVYRFALNSIHDNPKGHIIKFDIHQVTVWNSVTSHFFPSCPIFRNK